MSECGCESPIDPATLESRQRRMLVIVLGINVATFTMMVVESFLSGSL